MSRTRLFGQEAEGRGDRAEEEGSGLTAYSNNLLHTQALESKSSHPTLWGRIVKTALHPTVPFQREDDFGRKMKVRECVHALAAALKVLHSNFWRFSVTNHKAARAGTEHLRIEGSEGMSW